MSCFHTGILNYIYYQSILTNFLSLYMLVLLLFDFEITLQCKKNLSPEPLDQFQPNLAQCIIGWRGFKYVQMKAPPFSKGDNYVIVKIHWRNLKMFFFRTTGPISTKFGAKHPWVKMIQVCSNEEPFNSNKVDNGFFSNLN